MYNEIEELEKSLKARQPAAAVPLVEPEQIDVDGSLRQDTLAGGQQERLFDLPPLPKAKGKGVYPSQYGSPASESVVGNVAPDYSGYDDLAAKLKGRQPRDTSLADLISMGASTGLAALMGRFSVGAKNAGEYGLDRFNKGEKRAETLEDQITQIEAAKAAKMAAGKKGTKVKSGGAADIGKPYQNRYTDPATGIVYTPTTIDEETGLYINDPGIDVPYSHPTVKTLDKKGQDGRLTQYGQMGNQVKEIGGVLPQLKTEKNALGETALLNDRTGHVQDLGDYFNKTGAGLSPHSDQQYKSISDKKNTDPLLKGLEGSYNDMSLGMSALGRGDVGNALVAVKMAASALEKGRMTSDKDLAQVSNINLGLATKMENILMGMMEGGKVTEPGRRELESLFATLEANTRDSYGRRLGGFNKQAATMLGREWRPELAFEGLPKFTGKKQEKLIETSLKTAKDTMSTGENEGDFIVNGKKIRAVYIMKGGKPYLLREVSR